MKPKKKKASAAERRMKPLKTIAYKDSAEILHALVRGEVDAFVIDGEVHALTQARSILLKLEEAYETMEAIRDGGVDGIVVQNNVYTLKGADAPYRHFVDQMSEGAATLDRQGMILYCNRRFAQMTGMAMDDIVGGPIARFVSPAHRGAFEKCIGSTATRDCQIECVFEGAGAPIHCLVSLGGLKTDDASFIYAIVTDLSPERRNRALEETVTQRTHELREANKNMEREMRERLRAEREMLEISNRERTRLGQDLHDGVSQILTGISYMVKTLEAKIAALGPGERERVGEISMLVRQAISEIKAVSRSLNPIEIESHGFSAALKELAFNTEKFFHVSCELTCDEEIDVREPETAMHLYRIAQEAIHNSVKHGKAKRIEMRCAQAKGRATLTVKDDGVGIVDAPDIPLGMGIRNMKHRARLINANLRIEKSGTKGTVVTCSFELPKPAAAAASTPR